MQDIINKEDQMITIAKVLIPNKYWILESEGEKFATLSKDKKGYSLFCKGQKIEVNTLNEIKERFGITINEDSFVKEHIPVSKTTDIYGFPLKGKAYSPLWNVQKRLPIYAKSEKSKSLFCAGYYIIKFRKGWCKAFCPKLITLERNEFKGPFTTEVEMRTILKVVSKD